MRIGFNEAYDALEIAADIKKILFFIISAIIGI